MYAIRVKGFVALVTMAMFLAGSNSILAVVLTTGTGPGGVGLSNGTSTLRMWYNADALSLSNNAAVSSWTDSSGYGKTATQGTAASQPVFKTGVTGFNNRPVVRFDGNDSMPITGGYTFAGTESYFFVHAPTENGTGGRSLLADATTFGNAKGLIVDLHFASQDDRYWTETAYTLARQWGVNGGTLNTVGTLAPFVGYAGGPPRVAPPQIAYAQTNPVTGNSPILTLAGAAPSAQPFVGDIAEGIVFSNTVNTTQRSIIENYLSSKYDITLAAGDRYAGDIGGNGDYDEAVFGIGRTSSTNQHLLAGSAGFGFEAMALSNDQWLLAGNNDLTTLTATQWNRAWYLDGTNLTGTESISLAFDWSDAGVGSFNGLFTKLLYSATNGGPYTDIATGVYTGDRLDFAGLSSSLLIDGYYTIGYVPVPEPGAVTLMLVALVGFGGLRRRFGKSVVS